MRSEHRLGRDVVEHLRPHRNAVERIGIEHQRLFVFNQESVERIESGVIGADTGTYGNSVVGMSGRNVAGYNIVLIGIKESLGHRRLESLHGATRSMNTHHTGSGTHGGTGSKHSGAEHSITAGNKQRRTEIVFVGKGLAPAERALHIAAFHQIFFHLGGVDCILAQLYVERFICADKTCILREEER